MFLLHGFIYCVLSQYEAMVLWGFFYIGSKERWPALGMRVDIWYVWGDDKMPKGSFGSCQSPGSRVAALASMSLALPKPKRQSSADRGSPRQRKHSETKDQQNAQLVVSALDLAVEDRRLAEFRTRCLVQENPPFYRWLFSNLNLRLIFLRRSRSALGRWRGTS